MKKLIALMLVQNIVIGQIQVPPEDGLDLFNNMMKYLFDNCRTEFGTIGFWGTDRIFLANDEVDFALLNDSKVFERSPIRRIKSLVAVFDESFHHNPKVDLFKVEPTLEIESMFVFHKSGNRKKTKQKVFQWYQMLFQNSKVYYCYVSKRKIVIITLNSFADVAPALWRKSSQINSDNNRNNGSIQWWTYRAEYKKETKFNYVGSQLCKNIFFDRTEKLNGYTIRAAASINYPVDPIFEKIHRFITKATDISQSHKEVDAVLNVREGLFSKALENYLNLSIKIIYGAPTHTVVITYSFLRNSKIDIDLSLRSLTDGVLKKDLISTIHPSYPFRYYYEQIVTQNRGLATPLEKMFEFYGYLTPIATSIIFLVVLAVVYRSKPVNNSKFSFAVFECLRLLIGNSIYTRMDTAKTRIFFSVIFLYFLFIQTTFSGHLAAFLTKPVYRKNVETLEDLEDPQYTKIYADDSFKNYIKSTPLYNKTLFYYQKCEQYIKDPSVACFDKQDYLSPLIARYDLHTPKNFVKQSYSAFLMPHNSALKHRIDNLLMHLEQSGISNIWNEAWPKMFDETAAYHLKKIEDIENYHRPIELEDLTFAFYLLGIGLFFGIISFILENSLKTYVLYKTKVRSWLLTLKRSTTFLVRFVIFEFHRLLKWLYISLVKVVSWMRVRI